MRSRLLVRAPLAGVLVLAACSDGSRPSTPDAPEAVVARTGGAVPVIIVLDASFAPGGHAANRAQAGEVARGLGIAPVQTYGTALFGFSATVPEGRLNALERDPRVAYWEVDQVASIPFPREARPQAPPWCSNPENAGHPACSGDDDGGEGGSQTTPWGVSRVGGARDGSGKRAFVIDTGVDLSHADLVVSQACSANFVTRGKDSPADGNGHGTHVAGTIAAQDNDQDVVGVAAGATVCAIRVLDNSGSGSYSWVIAGVDHVAATAASGDVANMSLGGPASSALDAAVVNAAGRGIRFAIAAGNSGAFAGDQSPARVNHANVYTVSAIGQSDCLASWSNWGNPPVDYAAPGVGVLSTKRGGGTTTMSGTSMAAPHVAGLLLLGNVRTDGHACGDPDGTADPIAHR